MIVLSPLNRLQRCHSEGGHREEKVLHGLGQHQTHQAPGGGEISAVGSVTGVGVCCHGDTGTHANVGDVESGIAETHHVDSIPTHISTISALEQGHSTEAVQGVGPNLSGPVMLAIALEDRAENVPVPSESGYVTAREVESGIAEGRKRPCPVRARVVVEKSSKEGDCCIG